ncbi:MAG: CDP-alcohol phosphatidyltransferase family protein [Coriobacteriia bacterium]|nr:CDP-alcohol phosphatidyltransferase family protein [Coriobacteriia bacterium]
MVETDSGVPSPDGPSVDHSHDVYTLANIITVLRLMLVPFAFAVFISGKNDMLAFLLFALAASTDWLDGQIARRTGTVTEIGKAIDPLVDRLLLAAGVLGLYIEERVPLWVVLFLLARDVYLLVGAAYLAKRGVSRLPVIFTGKLTTLLLLVGFAGLILGVPEMPGLGVVESQALPGFGADPVVVWMWFVYAGIVASAITAVVYTSQAFTALRAKGAVVT